MPAKARPNISNTGRTSARAAHRQPAVQCVVGIGASAGGFEPIRELVNSMPADSGLAFVVIQHLTPTHKSFAAELLGRHTAMKVVEITDGMRVEPNCVYTAPSDKFLTIEGGVLRLVPLGETHGLRLPVDRFFGSLGADQCEKAIGIILSGTGADGTLGAKSIFANGGIVLAQSPETAQFEGMPRSVIGAGVVNQVLPVQAMPKALLAYARHPYTAGKAVGKEPGESEDHALDNLLSVIRARRGFDFSGYKHGTLLRRVRRRMALLNIDAIGEYCALLEHASDELDALYRDLFIGVTEFFRDAEAWDTLRTKVIAPLVTAYQGAEPIRAWVPGCASGEEAYTLAMLLLAALKDAGKTAPLQVFATDLNEEALQFARAGVYPAGIATHIPPALLRQHFFDGAAPGHYQVTPALRGAVTFSRQNLLADPPFSRLDIISCRNVLIYLEPALQDRALALFRFALKPRGHLFLGSAETIGKHGRLFGSVSKKWRIFEARGTLPRTELPVRLRDGKQSGAPEAGARPVLRAADASNIARELILDRYAPAAVLVNSNFEALYYSGPTENFLMRRRGVPTRNLLLLVREGLRPHLAGALRKALTSQRTAAVANARIKRGKHLAPVKITVAPASHEQEQGRLFLVVFEDIPPAAKAATARGRESALVRALEADLRATQRDLQNVIEDREITKQELTDAHEEVMSSNEELRSINEELESSKEELQSLNEELNTVNQQLQNKVAELESANNNLNNVIASSEIATLWLDREMRIKWSTPAMQSAFHVLPTDAGRLVSDLGPPLTDAGLLADAAAVCEKLVPLEHEQTTKDGRHFLRRIVPFQTEKARAEGVIVTFSDMTVMWNNARMALDAKKVQAEALRQQVHERTAQLRELAFALVAAEEQERRNLAQNLHDDLAQVLSVAQIKLAALGKNAAAGDAQAGLTAVNALLAQASRTVHSLAFQLSPSVLYELGLMPAIDWLCEEMQRLYGLHVTVHDDGNAKPLDERVKVTLYRAVRELLINVAKHASVNTAVVSGRREKNCMVIEVRDDGAGFNTEILTSRQASGGFGLVSVRERLQMVGGSVHVDSLPGDGTTITLAVPLAGAVS